MTKLDELRGLLEKATSAPWTASEDTTDDPLSPPLWWVRADGLVADLLAESNARLIASLRNNAEALLAVVEAAKAEIARRDRFKEKWEAHRGLDVAETDEVITLREALAAFEGSTP